MAFELEEWGTFDGVGRGHGFKHGGRFYAILETRAGAYRGNHIHPHSQYTLLLSGRARYLEFDGERREAPLIRGRVVEVKAGVPHILVVEEDALTFEWWDGDFTAEDCAGIFEDITRGRIGPNG